MCELPGLELIVADFSAVGVAFARDYRSDKRMLTKFTLVHPSVRQAFYVSSSGSSQVGLQFLESARFLHFVRRFCDLSSVDLPVI